MEIEINDLPDNYLSQLQATCPDAIPKIIQMLQSNRARLQATTEMPPSSVFGVNIEILSNGKVKTVDLMQYARRCAKNKSIDDVRRSKSLRRHGKIIAMYSNNRLPADPAAELLKQENRMAARLAIESLSPKLRITARLHWVEGMTQAEVSEELGIPTKTVYDRLGRAEPQLRAVLNRASDTDRN